MTLKQFVELYCPEEAEVTVSIMPGEDASRGPSVELALGKGTGAWPDYRGRPVLERYSSAALAEMVCVCPAAHPGEIHLLATTDWRNRMVLAAQILKGNLAGRVN